MRCCVCRDNAVLRMRGDAKDSRGPTWRYNLPVGEQRETEGTGGGRGSLFSLFARWLWVALTLAVV